MEVAGHGASPVAGRPRRADGHDMLTETRNKRAYCCGPKPPPRRHCWRPAFGPGRYILWVAAVTVGLALTGCCTRDNPPCNLHAPTSGEPTLLQRADGLVSTAEDALDSLDRCIDNTID